MLYIKNGADKVVRSEKSERGVEKGGGGSRIPQKRRIRQEKVEVKVSSSAVDKE